MKIRWWRSYLFVIRILYGRCCAGCRWQDLEIATRRPQLAVIFRPQKSSGRNRLNFHQNWITRWSVGLPAKKNEKVWHVRMHPPADCITSNGSIQVLEYSLGELHEQVSFHFVENCWNWSHSESYTPFTWTLPAVAMWPGRQRLGWTI